MYRRLTTFLQQFEKSLWILSIGWFVGALGFAASIPFLSIYFYSQLGMSTIEIGIFFGVMALVRALFQLVGGEMSDRMGRTGLLIHSQIYRALAFGLLGAAIQFDWGFWVIAGLVTINSILGAVFMSSVNALVADILPREKRLDGYAVTRAAGNLGWAVGPAIGGFLAHSSYASLFYISAVITLASGLIFWRYLTIPSQAMTPEAFKFSDLMEVRKDSNLARHCVLIFFLYLVVAQLVAPFSVYTVKMIHLSEAQLGMLFTLNGLMVTLLQIPVTRFLARQRLTAQLAGGAALYFVGYGILGLFGDFSYLLMVIVIVTTGEMIMSPPALTLASRMAPEGRMGRYMGIFGFFTTAGWSFGPLYGGFFLDHFADSPELAWLFISSLALMAALGYVWFRRIIPIELDRHI